MRPGDQLTRTRYVASSGLRDHEQVVRRFLDAFEDHDLGAASACMSQHMRLHIPGGNQLAGTFTGRDAVEAYLQRIWRQADVVWRIVSYEDWLVSDHRVLLVAGVHVQLPGRERNWRRHLLFDVPATGILDVDELAIESLQVFEGDDQTLIDAFIDRSWLT